MNKQTNSNLKMKSILVLRIAILACAFLGGLLAIIAAAGTEWQKSEYQEKLFTIDIFPRKIVVTIGLWKYCSKAEGIGTQCRIMKIGKSSLKGRLTYLQSDPFMLSFMLW